MPAKKKYPLITFLNFLMFFVCIMLFSSGAVNIGIKNAHPFLSLALLIVFSCYSTTAQAVTAGFVVGAFTDSIASGSYCFNTLCLFALALFANLLAHNVFNKNLKATVSLCLLLTAVYYIIYWAVFISDAEASGGSSRYLLEYALPSVVYTSVFSIPFYFIYKKFEKIKNQT